MVIHACAPMRGLDLGGWTDGAFAEYGGVLNCAIAAMTHVTLQPRGQAGIQLRPFVEDRESVGDLRLAAEFAHVAARHFGVDGVELTIAWDIPPGHGVGAAASAAIALTGALATCAGASYAPLQLAGIAHRLQVEEMGRICGLQSHLAAALGGIAYYRLEPYPRAFPTPDAHLPHLARHLEEHLLLVRTRRRHGNTLYPRLARQCQKREAAARLLLWKMRAFAEEGYALLCREDFSGLGALTAEHAALQQRWAPGLLCPTTRHIQAIARNHQAWAVKNNGTGGSLTILCPAQVKAGLEEELRACGYDVRPVSIDQFGLQVWTYEPAQK